MRAICAALLGWLVCAGLPAGAQTISVYVDSDVAEVDPHFAETFAEFAVVDALHCGLVEYDTEGNLIAGLAESWSVDASGKSYVFNLRPGLTWSDGRPLTAPDIVAGIRRALDPARPAPFARQLGGLSNGLQYMSGTIGEGERLGVDAPDALTVIFTLADSDYTFLSTLALPVAMPAPASAPDAIEDGALTSGFYTVSAPSADTLTLEDRDGNVQLAIIPEISAESAWIKSAEQDHFISASFPIVTVPSIGERGDHVRLSGGDALYSYVVNTSRPPLNTLEVRHALAMAINRDTLLGRAPIRNASPALDFVPPRGKTYQTSYKTPYASLSEEEREAVAEALFADAGYGRGNRFTVRLRIPAGDIHRRIAEAVADQWARSGIATEIVDAPFPDHWRAVMAGDFDVAFAAWPGPRDTPRTFLEPLSARGGPWNFARYMFEGFDDRLARAAQSEKIDAQARHYREAEKALIEDQTLFALFYYRPLAIVSPHISGWRSNPTGLHPIHLLSANSLSDPLDLIRPEVPRAVPSAGQTK